MFREIERKRSSALWKCKPGLLSRSTARLRPCLPRQERLRDPQGKSHALYENRQKRSSALPSPVHKATNYSLKRGTRTIDEVEQLISRLSSPPQRHADLNQISVAHCARGGPAETARVPPRRSARR
ncbi:hypothetical protein AAFF_G00041600 [Aldrovandia affinis]|uniref:Uncharacterized protein n=1 Tax=Aldrovandia affinis TaxID=143900 RepID=A0AAD7S2Q1_9TELE|nr:hypothetical protein AAFF_G00041600 [Aldrovandia affinis]